MFEKSSKPRSGDEAKREPGRNAIRALSKIGYREIDNLPAKDVSALLYQLDRVAAEAHRIYRQSRLKQSHKVPKLYKNGDS